MGILDLFVSNKEASKPVVVSLENPVTEAELSEWSNPVALNTTPEVELTEQTTDRSIYGREAVQALLNMASNGYYGFSYAYNGEKDQGGIGPLIDYFLDYDGLRSRSWKAYLDSEIAQTVLGRKTLWTVGTGLKLQCEPVSEVLAAQGFSLSEQDFNDNVEARFMVYANSSEADFSRMRTLHQQAFRSYLDAKVGGDMLVIMRYINDQVRIQLIDGTHVRNPTGFSMPIAQLDNDNILKDGIEIDQSGKHVAYYVRKRGIENNGTNDLNLNFDSERIEAVSKSSGLVMAFMVRGLDYRLDNVRSIPMLSAVMQTMTSMERYKEATLGSAEEAAKIVLAIQHDALSDGADPFEGITKHARGTGNLNDKIAIDSNGQQVADKIAVTTGKQVVNLQRGSSMHAFTGEKELYFKDFYTINIECVCAALSIPPAVAMSKYDTSYSSSRAAIKDWEHTLNVERAEFAIQFYSKVYAFWLDTEILKGNIKAPGYLEARSKKDFITLAAYRNARWVGASVPHIDPVKEVEAIRLMLGETGANLPLTTQEQACETLSTGESDSITEQYARELEQSLNLKIKPLPVEAVKPAVQPAK